MGQVSARGTFMNLYLNGKNNGYYNPTERIDSDFLNSWNGSDSEWDIIAQFGELREGDTVKWNELKSALLKNLSVPQNYAAVERLFDVDNFIDYIMLNVYANTGDWPHNNWRPPVNAARRKWRFIVWDAEWRSETRARRFGNNLTRGRGRRSESPFFPFVSEKPRVLMRFADGSIHYFKGALTEKVLPAFEMKEEFSAYPKNEPTVERTWVRAAERSS
ncbi:MAG: hypothetical protein CM1200mP34_2050 [Verrucomicrobiales bacterium]|nr:MAG: hypothetical protein CM1200mP34_2050 [Verrucomicrobiales bacterium]